MSPHSATVANGPTMLCHEEVVAEAKPVRHANIRGQSYYYH